MVYSSGTGDVDGLVAYETFDRQRHRRTLRMVHIVTGAGNDAVSVSCSGLTIDLGGGKNTAGADAKIATRQFD